MGAKSWVNSILFAATLAVIIFILITFDKCNKPCEPTVVTKDSIVYQDTTIYRDSIVTQWRWKDSIVEVPADVDTGAILADFFTRYFYEDTIRPKANVTFVISDTVTRNRIASRRYSFQDTTKYVTNIYTEHINNGKNNAIGISLLAIARDTAYNLGIGFDFKIKNSGFGININTDYSVGVKYTRYIYNW